MNKRMRVRTLMGAMLLVALAQPALADSAVLQETCEILSRVVRWLVGVGYATGVIGFAFLSIKTSASGRFRSGDFLGLMGGMFLLGAVPSFIAFLVKDTFSYTC